jgi:hypothetical protein
MRLLSMALCLAGCLDVPPALDEPVPTADGGVQADAGGDSPILDCPSGAHLELAYASEITFSHDGQESFTFEDVAVLINPGPEPLQLVPVAAEVVTLPGLQVVVTLASDEEVVAIGPGQAHGALSIQAEQVVSFGEDWVDTSAPRLSIGLGVNGDALEDGSEQVAVALEVADYAFDLSIRLVDDPEQEQPRLTGGTRASASCD